MIFAYALLVEPFVEFGFMRRALAACLALGAGCGPLGVFLILRRMSLVGDALSHAVLPGAAVGFLASGLSLYSMSIGGFVAGVAVAVLAGLVARATPQREDAAFAALYLIALAVGVLLISLRGDGVDLLHVLFGSVLAVDGETLLLVASVAIVTLGTIAMIARGLIADSFDPHFLRAVGGPATGVHIAFLVLVVLNLVAGFQALGTLMAIGLMMLPGAAARFWANSVAALLAASLAIASVSGYAGLLLSYHAGLPSGPSIILVAGIAYLLSLAAGRYDSLWQRHCRRDAGAPRLRAGSGGALST